MIRASTANDIQTVRELIDRLTERQPQCVCLVSPETGRELTFGELREQAILVAGRLRAMGLENGDKVAMSMDNGLFTALLFLGTMYSGFVSVPLNVRAGASQLSYTLDHSEAKVVFVAAEYRSLIDTVLAEVRRPIQVVPAEVDHVFTGCETGIDATAPTAPQPEDAALLMYTSGSTGQPKGAVHCHRSVLAGARNSIEAHQLTSADRSLLVLPLYHINAECVTLIPTLLSGGTVVVPHRFSVSQFWDLLDDHRCTWSAVVPTIISQLLDWPDPRAHRRAAAFQRIRFLRSSSAPLSPSLHREFLDKFKLLLIQAMGSTECGNIFSTPLPPGENKIGSPGRPWGFEARIIDRDGADVPPGEPGEVLLRGPAIMQGYYKDQQGTAAVVDPDGWLHTGDLAYCDRDGYFFVVGRSKELIIKGGVNIAPKQIDEVLESHPAVLEAAAVGIPDRYLGEDLVAYVVLRAGMSGDERELLAFCETRLGHFKTPSRIHFAKDLPKGPSGKVQRLRLLEPAAQAAAEPNSRLDQTNGHVTTADMATAATPIEQIIAAIWAEALAQPRVDVRSNFFALGGHSLLALQCLSRLREKLPIALSLSDFFENATVAQQAALIRARLFPDDGAAPKSEAAWEQELLRLVGSPAVDQTIPPRDRSLPCPLSPGQQRIWFMEQLNASLPVYNESEAVALRGALNVESLEAALNAIIARHEILRTTIAAGAEEPAALVLENWRLKLKQIDLSALPPAQRQAEVDRLLVEEPRRPYRLETEPGIRATVLRLGPREHVLILMMHHIICDWSSEGVLWRELSALYRADCHGEPLILPPLPIQHGDYAAWQQQQMASTDLATDLAYWEEHLRGAPALLELPADRPRPNVNSYAGSRQRFRIPSALAKALRECARREKISLFTLFTAALDTLLYRYTGQDDILVGIPLADRDRPELQSVIGFLLHVHVLRTRLSGDLSFRELLARVQRDVLDLYAHRAAPFDQIVSRVHPERNLSYSPLFQVMINWRDRDQQLSFIGLHGLEVESLLAESRISKFDLSLCLTDDDQDIWLEVEYSTDLFDDDRIERMAGHYQTLLAAIAADPAQSLADLPLLTDAERQHVLVDWNRADIAYPQDRCAHELIEEQAERAPESTAVVFEGQRLTYRQLNERANQLAHYLRKLGVGPDVFVGLAVDRSFDLVVGLLAILKAGGAYVPLDISYPKQRLSFMMADTGLRVVVTQRSVLPLLPENSATRVCLDADWNSISTEATDNPAGRAGRANLAYVIYTSGSTGKPKGVLLEHGPLAQHCIECQHFYELKASDRVLQFASPSFDVSIEQMLPPLMSGATVVMRDRASWGLPEFQHKLEELGLTVINLPPAYWHELSQAWADSGDPIAAPALRLVLIGGEAMSPGTLQLWRRTPLKDVQLCNAYGPTETVITATTYVIPAGEAEGTPLERIPIGRVRGAREAYVLDRWGQPVPVGVSGELYLGGSAMARGYHNRPGLTAEKFVSNPFNSDPASRLYKTGDLVRYLPDGNIEFLGRLDEQVKIRGFRIELGEIETVLMQHPGVKTAAVVAREDSPGEKRLAAYVVSRNGALSGSELREFLRKKLPEYMVPSAFVTSERLPLTPNGKLDRKALRPPDEQAIESQEAYVPPRTPMEEAIADIWIEVLGIHRIGINHNIFDLGGHSLLAARVISRVRGAFEVDLPLRSVFESPTVAGMAAALLRLSVKPAELERRAELFLQVTKCSAEVVDQMLAANPEPHGSNGKR